MTYDDLPRTDGVAPISDRMLRALRPASRRAIARRWQVHVHGAEHVPAAGPQIVAANHLGLADGPLLAAYHPRPVHVLTKREMFEGGTGRFLRVAGQIPLDRFDVDPGAVKACVRLLRRGRVVGIFPEGTRGSGELLHAHPGCAYLALVTGAPVVPVAIFGTREPGGGINSVPPRGTRIDVVYGAPVRVEARPWPRTREQIRTTSVFLHEALRAHLDSARALTGRELPGPLPETNDVVADAALKELTDD